MKIRYKFGVWMLCLMFPALVWAENAKVYVPLLRSRDVR